MRTIAVTLVAVLLAVLLAGCAALGNGGGELKTTGEVKAGAVKMKR